MSPKFKALGVARGTHYCQQKEPRGIPCNQDRNCNADPDYVSCSRSFGEQITMMDALTESIASFTAQAATKLRRLE